MRPYCTQCQKKKTLAMARMVSRQPPTAVAGVWSQTGACEIYGGRRGSGPVLLRALLYPPLSVQFHRRSVHTHSSTDAEQSLHLTACLHKIFPSPLFLVNPSIMLTISTSHMTNCRLLRVLPYLSLWVGFAASRPVSASLKFFPQGNLRGRSLQCPRSATTSWPTNTHAIQFSLVHFIS